MEQQEFILPEIVKDSWDKITLKEFDEIQDIENNNGLCLLEKEMKLISIFFNVEEDVAWTLSTQQVLNLMAKINPIKNNFKINEEFGKEVLKTNPKSTKKEINIGERKYEIETDVNNITYAQYVQFQATDKQKIKDVLGILLVPKDKVFGRDYNLIENTEYIYSHISFQMSQDILFFMTKHFLSSLNYFLTSLSKKERQKVQQMMEKMRNNQKK